MASNVFLLATGLLVLVVICAAVSFIVIIRQGTCSKVKSPIYEHLLDGLNSDCSFKTISLRLMAERIYEYRSLKEFIKPGGQYVSIFMATGVSSPPPVASLSDIALFKLATASKDRFSILISYIPIFNHPRYVECLKAYSKKSLSFKSIDSSRTTRDIIIKDLLGVGNRSRDELKSTLGNYFKQSIPASSFANMDQFITAVLLDTPDTKIYELLQTGYGV